MSKHFFYKKNLKLLHQKHQQKKMNNCSEGPFTPFPP